MRTLIENRGFWLILLAALAGLYAIFAFDIFADEGAVDTRRMRIELNEILLFGSALVLMLFGFGFNQHRAHARELARRIEAEQDVRTLGYHDALTGIANRRAFEEALRIALAGRRGARHGVFLIDLNGFKAINDTHGHAEGDAVLVAVARRIALTVREGDCAARFGGDEFAVLAPGIDKATADGVAQRIMAALAKPVDIEGRRHHVGAGIGIALAQGGADLAETVRKADAALYLAKAEPDSAWRFSV